MAKKPAKRNVTNTVSVPKIDEGFNVLYIGLGKTVGHTCPICTKMTKKGIVREYKSVVYCSVGCVRDVKKKEDAQ